MSETPGSTTPSAREVLATPGVTAFLVAQFTMTVGVMLQAAALGKHIYDITGNELDIGWLGLAEFLPAALLVLVTGTTGSGKSTTLAALVDHLNRTKRLRIVTIEDPIEFVHESQKCLVAQREIGRDTPDFAESLKRALRQDPDVILVGELRDAETMRIALQAASVSPTVPLARSSA